MQLLVDQAEVLQQFLLPLPVEDVVCYFEGLLFIQPQQQRPDDKVHPYIYISLTLAITNLW